MSKPFFTSLIIALLLLPATVHAAGGTSQVASKGQKVSERANWPKGLAALLNMPTRTDGWNGWFSEWPNDVEHYQFEVANTAEANEVLEKFGAIKSDKLQVRLSPGKEPGSIGWVSRIKAGNNTAILYSHGDQQRLDEWFVQLGGGKFGVMEFEKVPTAVPPTLTIFVENEAIDLEALKIPAHVTATAGAVPGLFDQANMKVEATKPAPAPPKVMPPSEELKRVLEKIDGYLAKRKKVS